MDWGNTVEITSPGLPPNELEEVRGESEVWAAATVTQSLMNYQ